MKKRVEVRTLCGVCRINYKNSGYTLTKISGQKYKDDCDICRTRKGWEYSVTEERSGRL